MPSPNFLAKAFIAGFLIGHLFIPAQKSWVFNLVRSPAFDLIPPGLSYWNSANVGNEALQTQGVGQLLHLVADLNLPVSLLPLPGNLSVTSSLPTGSRFSPTRPQTSRPTFSRGNLTLVLPTNSNLVTHRPSATQTPFSTTPYYVYGSSAPGKLRIPVAMPLFRHTRSGYSRFALTVLLLLCVSVLLYHVTLLMYRKWRLEHKMRRLPERAVSMIITNFQDDPQSLKACSLVSRSWTIESQRYLFRKISLDSKRSSDFWFSSDSLGLANHVRSICMSMGAIVGTERGLSGFPRVETLRVAGWRRSQHSPPGWWSPLGQTVRHLELIRPKGTLQEILAFVSLFTTLESLHITPSNQPFRCEVRATRAGDPEAISIHLRMPRQPPVSGPGLTRSCTDDGVSLRLHLDTQEFDEPFTVLFARATKACSRCLTGRRLTHPLSRLIRLRYGRTITGIRIDTLPEEMINVVDDLLISLPFVSPQLTKVTIERFCDVDMILVDKILPKFRGLGGVVEIGEQRICI